jgi:hypothetical protein
MSKTFPCILSSSVEGVDEFAYREHDFLYVGTLENHY